MEDALEVGERTTRKVVSGTRALRMIAGRWEQVEQAVNINTNHQWERRGRVGVMEPQVDGRQNNN